MRSRFWNWRVVIARGANGSRECAPADRLRDEAIQLSSLSQKAGLLRGACHRAGLCADPVTRNDGINTVVSSLFDEIRITSRPGAPRLAPRECGRISSGCLKFRIGRFSAESSAALLASRAADTLHLSPCGRGRIASPDAIRVRGFAPPIDRDPHPNPPRANLTPPSPAPCCRTRRDDRRAATSRGWRRGRRPAPLRSCRSARNHPWP